VIPLHSVLDPQQLQRIESVHRGFLYQHLYAVACLLVASASGVTAIDVERDEDVEVMSAGRRSYLQVKTRNHLLWPSDVDPILVRFDELRNHHRSRARKHEAADFWIVSNQGPSPELGLRMSNPSWPSDAKLIWPESTDMPAHLPRPWKGIEEAFAACVSLASSLPFSRLAPETLVWKVAARVQHACTGVAGVAHRFLTSELQGLFEQVFLQLEHFPLPPLPYLAQEGEPAYESTSKLRVVIGISGAGKTAWAGQLAQHSFATAVYCDCATTAGPALAGVITREIVARLLSRENEHLANALAPGRTGIDSLKIVASALKAKGNDCVVVLDNAHRVDPDDVISVVRSESHLRWIVLGQPTPTFDRLVTTMVVSPEDLLGWSIDTIAAVFDSAGCPISITTAERVRRLTGALPLYVANAVKLAAEVYKSDGESLCNDIEHATHTTTTAQEVILAKVSNVLSPSARQSLAMLSLSEVPLQPDEAKELLSSSGLIVAQAAASLRELASWGVTQRLLDGELAIHDSFRVIATSLLLSYPSATVDNVKGNLKALLQRSILKDEGDENKKSVRWWKGTHARRRAFLRLLPQTGELKTLLDLASNEAESLAEQGYSSDLIDLIRNGANDGTQDAEQRFWAFETLALWSYQLGDMSEFAAAISSMAELVRINAVGDREKGALAMKQMLLHGKRKDRAAIEAAFADANSRHHGDPVVIRIVRYNYALALYFAEDFSKVESITLPLIAEYYDVLGLEMQDTFAKNPPEIWPKIKDAIDPTGNLKRLADTLDLHASSLTARGIHPRMSRMHAFKFYNMAGSVTSTIRAGQDVVDELIGIRDHKYARQFMERGLIRAVTDHKLLEHMVRVRGQYAVVLARCGEIEKAREEIGRIKPFAAETERDRMELEGQGALIEAIAEHGPNFGLGPVRRLERDRMAAMFQELMKPKKVPNLCRCGSGKKARNCCERKRRR
jgi:hypothetical protein